MTEKGLKGVGVQMMPWYIDATAKVHAQVYDGQSEVWRIEEVTVADALEAYSVDGCPKPADVAEIKHGEWVRDADLVDGDVWVRWSCSECGYVRTRGWEDTEAGTKPHAKLCENCGAILNEREQNGEEK